MKSRTRLQIGVISGRNFRLTFGITGKDNKSRRTRLQISVISVNQR
jgi:hypothetical protein